MAFLVPILQQIATSIILLIFSEKFLKRMILMLLKWLKKKAKQTNTTKDDKLIEELENSLKEQ